MPCRCRDVFNMKTEAKKTHHVLGLKGYQIITIFVVCISDDHVLLTLVTDHGATKIRQRRLRKSDPLICSFATGLLLTSCTANILCDLMCHVSSDLYHVLNYCPMI